MNIRCEDRLEVDKGANPYPVPKAAPMYGPGIQDYFLKSHRRLNKGNSAIFSGEYFKLGRGRQPAHVGGFIEITK